MKKEDFIVGHGSNSLNALRAGKGQVLYYVLPDDRPQDTRSYKEILKDEKVLRRFNSMLAEAVVNKNMKKVIGAFPTVALSDFRQHLMELQKSNTF